MMYNNNISPLQHDQHTIIQQDHVETDGMCGGCCCFRVFFIKRPRTSHTRGINDEDEEEFLTRSNRDSWAARKLKEVKEFSEVVAGPKWKNFIRKIGGYFNGNKRRRNMKRQDFQYDSFEYELNFDNEDDLDDQDRLRFSTKFAPPPFYDHAQRTSVAAT